jgi:hypothetical protein
MPMEVGLSMFNEFMSVFIPFMLSPTYEPDALWDRAISLACSTESSHSCVLYLLPAGSEVVARGSSKVRCLSRCELSLVNHTIKEGRKWRVESWGGKRLTVSILQAVKPLEST